MRSMWVMHVAGGLVLSALLGQSGLTQQRTIKETGADWPMYRHDTAGTGYSPLTQLDTKSVANLTQVWTYRLQGDAPAAPTGRGGQGAVNSEATPIVVNGIMYLPAANRVVALEPETGKVIWQYVLTEGLPQRRSLTSSPGDGNN